MRAILGMALLLVASTAGAGQKPMVLSPHDAGPHDAGPPETAGQSAYRKAYISKTTKHEMEVTKDHAWTPDVGAVENLHWRRAYRALRIRELAEDDKDTGAIARVDAYLTKLDQHFFTALAAVVADAPAIPPAPTVAAPAKGTSLAVGSPVTINITPVAGATHYYVLLWGQGHHVWSDYNPTTKAYGTATTITIPANDPKWAAFENGKANVLVRAMSPDKTKKGVAYTLWTHTAQIPVTITGGAAATPVVAK